MASTLKLTQQAQKIIADAPQRMRLSLQRQLERRAKEDVSEKTRTLMSAHIMSMNEKIDRIENTSNVTYYVIIITAIFKDSFDPVTSLISAIPIAGIAIDILLSTIIAGLYTLNSIVLLKMKEMDEEVKSHSRFYWHIFVLSTVFFLDGFLPFIDILPLTSVVAILLYLGVRRERKKEINRIEEELTEIGAARHT